MAFIIFVAIQWAPTLSVHSLLYRAHFYLLYIIVFIHMVLPIFFQVSDIIKNVLRWSDSLPLFFVWLVMKCEGDGFVPRPLQNHVHQSSFIGRVVPLRQVGIGITALWGAANLNTVDTPLALEPWNKNKSYLQCLQENVQCPNFISLIWIMKN